MLYMFFVVDYSHLSNEQPYILRMQAFLLNIVVKFTSEVARILAQKKNENRNTVSISSSAKDGFTGKKLSIL